MIYLWCPQEHPCHRHSYRLFGDQEENVTRPCRFLEDLKRKWFSAHVDKFLWVKKNRNKEFRSWWFILQKKSEVASNYIISKAIGSCLDTRLFTAHNETFKQYITHLV